MEPKIQKKKKKKKKKKKEEEEEGGGGGRRIDESKGERRRGMKHWDLGTDNHGVYFF